MSRKKKPWHHKDVLEAMYVDQELTLREMAQILETTPSNILYHLRKFSIPTRQFNIGDVNRDKTLSDEEKTHLSEIAKERFSDKRNHPMFGRRHTEESKRKMSETKKRKRRERLGEQM
jgi:hypothetical protein